MKNELDSKYHKVYWLDETAESAVRRGEQTLGQAIGQGQAVVCLFDMADPDEAESLFQSAIAARQARDIPTAARGRSRFSVSDPTAFGIGESSSSSNNVVLLCDEILLRVLDELDEGIPSIFKALFVPPTGMEDWVAVQPLNAQLEQPSVPPSQHLADMCDGLRDLYMMSELEWSEGEPAINVYESGGYFGAHKDHLALTVLIPLTTPSEDFEGGGTGFWKGNRDCSENPTNEPDLILKPEAGSALIFGGDVTHAGMPVESGYRSVFVCSFSTKTPASPEDRLHGMQAPPKVSPNFKGTI